MQRLDRKKNELGKIKYVLQYMLYALYIDITSETCVKFSTIRVR